MSVIQTKNLSKNDFMGTLIVMVMTRRYQKVSIQEMLEVIAKASGLKIEVDKKKNRFVLEWGDLFEGHC